MLVNRCVYWFGARSSETIHEDRCTVYAAKEDMTIWEYLRLYICCLDITKMIAKASHPWHRLIMQSHSHPSPGTVPNTTSNHRANDRVSHPHQKGIRTITRYSRYIRHVIQVKVWLDRLRCIFHEPTPVTLVWQMWQSIKGFVRQASNDSSMTLELSTM